MSTRDWIVHSSLHPVLRLGLDADLPGPPPQIGLIIRENRFGGYTIDRHEPKLSSISSGESVECDLDSLDEGTRGDLLSLSASCRQLAADLLQHATRLESTATDNNLIDESLSPQNSARRDKFEMIPDRIEDPERPKHLFSPGKNHARIKQDTKNTSPSSTLSAREPDIDLFG